MLIPRPSLKEGSRSLLVRVCIALAIALFAPAMAEAKGIDFLVVDQTGAPQRGAYLVVPEDNSGRASAYVRADKAGEINGYVGTAGQEILFRRTLQWDLSDLMCQTAEQASPEGIGVSYRIPRNPTSSERVRIVLPTLNHPDFVVTTPGDIDRERAAVGLINEAREANGIEKAEISATLSRAADKYATYMARNMQAGPSHCGYYDPSSRVMSEGFNGSVTETFIRGPWSSPARAIDIWLDSPGHRSLLLHGGNQIGLGSATVAGVTVWVAHPGRCYTAVGCELTGDFGDPSLAEIPEDGVDEEPPDDQWTPPKALPSYKIRSARVIKRGKAIKVIVRLDSRPQAKRIRGRAYGMSYSSRFRGKVQGRRVILKGRIGTGRWDLRARVPASENRQSGFIEIRIKAGKKKATHRVLDWSL